ncbi:MAG: hypothetical protein HDS58_04390 [Barnesiella sp.]|nr:hypothetical protein [Barnesiella sp.]
MLKIFPEQRPTIIDDIALHGVPSSAVSIYKGRNEVFALSTDRGKEINIKAFHVPRFPNSYIYTTLRKSKACRSYLNALKLIELGFHTPQPIAYVEELKAGALHHSYYISEQVPFRNIRNWKTIPDCATLIEDLGMEMHRLMTAGILNRDFSPGNILYEQLPDGHFRFYYVDLNRMEFNVRSHSRLMRMFRAITLDKDELRELAEAYARAASLPVKLTVDEAMRQHNNYLEEKRQLNKLKSIFK